MEANNTQNDENNSHQKNKKPFLRRLVFKYWGETIDDIKKTIEEEKKRHQAEQQSAKTEDERQANEQARANKLSAISNDLSVNYNKINLAMMLATIVAAGFTIAIFFYNKKAINSAVRSSEIADSTFKVTQKQFDIENTPYLELYDISLNFDKEGDTINFLIKSLGNNPVKSFANISYAFSTKKNRNQYLIGDIDSTIFKVYPIKNTRYISKETPIDLYVATFPNYTNTALDSIRNGDVAMFFTGKIIYANPQTNKLREYIFQIQLLPTFPNGIITRKPKYFFTYNENIDIPEDSMYFIHPDKSYYVIRDNKNMQGEIKEEQNEFNEFGPYFETVINSIDTISQYKIKISYTTFNISGLTTQVINKKFDYFVDTLMDNRSVNIDATFKSLKNETNFGINDMVFPGYPINSSFNIYPKSPDTTFEKSGVVILMEIGRLYLYIAEEVEFKDVNSDDKFLYRYIMKIKPYWGRKHEPFSQIIYHRIIKEE